jgi:hypothetical protein
MQENKKLVHCTTPGCTNTFWVGKRSTQCLCTVCRSNINKINRAQALKGGLVKTAG